MTVGTGMGLRLELFVRDMDASIDFYRRALGFELLRRSSAAGYAAGISRASRRGAGLG